MPGNVGVREGEVTSAIPLAKAGEQSLLSDPVPGVSILAASHDLETRRMRVEIGRSTEWSVNDVCFRQTEYVALNLSQRPLIFEGRIGGKLRRRAMDPYGLWLQRADVPFSARFTTSTYCGISVDRDRLVEVFCGQATPSTCAPSSFNDNDRVLMPLAFAIASKVRLGISVDVQLAESFMMALAEKLFYPARKVKEAALTDRAFANVCDFIEANIANDIGVRDLAILAGLSEFHFSRAFRRTTGLSPYQFIFQWRVERALALLKTSSSLAQIATRCGFSDQSHMSRSIRARFGSTPSEIRRIILGEARP